MINFLSLRENRLTVFCNVDINYLGKVRSITYIKSIYFCFILTNNADSDI